MHIIQFQFTKSSQKYLKFTWKEQLHQFCVLPNGLSPCPRWFTKLSKPPLAELRKSKHDISAYIDDIYLQDDTKANCIKNIIDTVTLLRSLGFTVHAEKSQFLPTQELHILGFTINSVNMTVSLKKEKKEQLACVIRKKINKKFVKIRKLAQRIGKIVPVLPGSRFGASYYRGLNKSKHYGLQKCKYNYEAYVELFQESITELTLWRENLPNMCRSIVMHQTLAGEHTFRVEIQGVTGHLKNIVT